MKKNCFFLHIIHLYIALYIYVCVCVCVCARARARARFDIFECRNSNPQVHLSSPNVHLKNMLTIIIMLRCGYYNKSFN